MPQNKTETMNHGMDNQYVYVYVHRVYMYISSLNCHMRYRFRAVSHLYCYEIRTVCDRPNTVGYRL